MRSQLEFSNPLPSPLHPPPFSLVRSETATVERQQAESRETSVGIVKGEGMDNSVETMKGEGTVNYLKEKEKNDVEGR